MKQGTAVELIQQSAAVSAATENINNEIQKTISKLYLNIYIRKYMSLCEGCSINMLLPSNIKYTSQSIIYRKHTRQLINTQNLRPCQPRVSSVQSSVTKSKGVHDSAYL